MPHTRFVEERLRFLGIDADAVDDIRAARGLIEPAIDGILDRFYERILQQPELRKLFADAESIDRARSAQRAHWIASLFSGKFDNDYFSQTAKIGRAHARVGLTPSWYISGYCYMLGQFVELISNEFGSENDANARCLRSVIKAVYLDMDLVLHCYLEAKDASMREILHRATDFRTDITVLTAELEQTAAKMVSAASVSALEDEAAARAQLAELAVTLSRQSKDIHDRLDQLAFSDRLYIAEDSVRTGTFSKLRSIVFGED